MELVRFTGTASMMIGMLAGWAKLPKQGRVGRLAN